MRHVSTMVSTALLLAATAVAPVGAAVKKMFTTSVWGSAQLSLWAEAQGQSGASAGDQICRTLAGAIARYGRGAAHPAPGPRACTTSCSVPAHSAAGRARSRSC